MKKRDWHDFDLRLYRDGDMSLNSHDAEIEYCNHKNGALVGLQCNFMDGTTEYREVEDACEMIVDGFRRLKYALEQSDNH